MTVIKTRRGSASQWTTANPILAEGEIGFETDTGKHKIGNGVSAWLGLHYFVDESSLSTTYALLLSTITDTISLSADGALTIGQVASVDASAAPRTMTLADGTAKGQVSAVEKSDAVTTNTVTINGSIRVPGGAGSIALTYQHETILFVWMGTYWLPLVGHRSKASIGTQIADALAADASFATAATAAVATAITAGGLLSSTKASEIARNRCPNPQFKGGPPFNSSPTAYTVSESASVPAGFPAVTTTGKVVRNGAALSSVIAEVWAGADSGAQKIVVTPGEVLSFSCYVWTSNTIASFARIKLTFRKADNSLVSTVDPGTSAGQIAPSTTVRLKTENVTVPALADHVVADIIVGTSGANSTAGDITYAAGFMVNVGTTAGAYGDGDQQYWAWLGAAQASQSIQWTRNTSDQTVLSALIAQNAAILAEAGQAAILQGRIYTSIVSSKNLYNPNDTDVLTDKFPSGSGDGPYSTLASYRVSGYIPVTVGQQISINPHRAVLFLKADKSSAATVVNTGNNATQATYTIPATCAFIRVAFQYTTQPNLQVEVGATQTSYEAYYPPKPVFAGGFKQSVDDEVNARVATYVPPGPLSVVVSGGVEQAIVTSQVLGSDGSWKNLAITMNKTASSNGGYRFGPTSYDGVQIASNTDDICPIRTQLGTIGANHGYAVVNTFANPDGKTNADLGSKWTDGSREYALLGFSAGRLVVGGKYTIDGGGVTQVVLTDPTANLTHVSGATHTGAIDYTTKNAAGADQLYPSTARRTVTYWLDGKQILADGTYTGTEWEVRDAYEILDYADIYDKAVANLGVSYTTLPVAGAVLVHNIWRWRPHGMCKFVQTLDELRPTTLTTVGGVQAIQITRAGRTTTRYVPGVGAVSGFDFSAGVDVTNTSPYGVGVSLALANTNLKTAGRVSAFHMDVLKSGSTVEVGFAMGYIPFGLRTDAVTIGSRRLTKTPSSLWNMRDTGKVYPAWTAAEAAGWGHLHVEAYRAFLNPAQVASVLTDVNDAYAAYAALSASTSVGFD